jgi:hypothetical protein
VPAARAVRAMESDLRLLGRHRLHFLAKKRPRTAGELHSWLFLDVALLLPTAATAATVATAATTTVTATAVVPRSPSSFGCA